MRQRIELTGAKLHVVDPIVFLVEVWCPAGSRLADAGVPNAKLVGGERFVAHRVGEGAVPVVESDEVAVVDGDRFYGVLTPASFVAAIQRVPAEVEGAAARR